MNALSLGIGLDDGVKTKGITVRSAVKKTAIRELNKLGPSFIEETISTFTFGLTSEVMKEKLGW